MILDDFEVFLTRTSKWKIRCIWISKNDGVRCGMDSAGENTGL